MKRGLAKTVLEGSYPSSWTSVGHCLYSAQKNGTNDWDGLAPLMHQQSFHKASTVVIIYISNKMNDSHFTKSNKHFSQDVSFNSVGLVTLILLTNRPAATLFYICHSAQTIDSPPVRLLHKK